MNIFVLEFIFLKFFCQIFFEHFFFKIFFPKLFFQYLFPKFFFSKFIFQHFFSQIFFSNFFPKIFFSKFFFHLEIFFFFEGFTLDASPFTKTKRTLWICLMKNMISKRSKLDFSSYCSYHTRCEKFNSFPTTHNILLYFFQNLLYLIEVLKCFLDGI